MVLSEQQSAALAALQVAAYTSNPQEQAAALIGPLAQWLRTIRMRSGNRYVDGLATRINPRNSVRAAVQNPFVPPVWQYEGKPKERRLVVLFDLTESMDMHRNWMALILQLLLKSSTHVRIFGLHHRVQAIELADSSFAAIQRAFRHASASKGAELTAFAFPSVLEQIQRQQSDARRLLFISDCMLPPSALQADPTWLQRAVQNALRWESITLLDPSQLGSGNPETGLLNVTAAEMKALIGAALQRQDNPQPNSLNVRSSETRRFANVEKVLQADDAAVVGRIHLAHPHFVRLSQAKQLPNRLFRLVPRATFNDLAKVLLAFWEQQPVANPHLNAESLR